MIKILLVLLSFFIHQTKLESKITETNFNSKHLSNYLSALIYSNNQKDTNSLKYFNSSKSLISEHEKFLENYIISLVENDQIDKAINELKRYENLTNTNFFEAKILKIVDLVKKRNYSLASIYSNKLQEIEYNNDFEIIIFEALYSYINLFFNNKITKINNEYGKFSLINYAFQQCFLDTESSNTTFINLINSSENDYSRYLYFYLNNLIRNKDFSSANQISSTINIFNSTLLISQSKKWIQNKNYNNLINPFSCQNPEDILSEFFFLISNLQSSQGNIKKSNFYLKISIYLNPKFYFNKSLLAENYYEINNYTKSQKVLNNFKKKDEIYHWYRIKKIALIISNTKNEDESLRYIKKEFNLIKNPNYKILYDLANIYKNFGKYEEAINFYNLVLEKIDGETKTFANVLYRRGSCYERMNNYAKSDEDLIKSLEINPDDPYVLNYLAYNWLERGYKLDTAFKMLLEAYNNTENDPYITDSLGWAYFLNGDYLKAEKFLKQAVQLRPEDPVIIDHYADNLWKLNRKLEAIYFWKNVLKIEDFKDVSKSEIKKKLIYGLDN